MSVLDLLKMSIMPLITAAASYVLLIAKMKIHQDLLRKDTDRQQQEINECKKLIQDIREKGSLQSENVEKRVTELEKEFKEMRNSIDAIKMQGVQTNSKIESLEKQVESQLSSLNTSIQHLIANGYDRRSGTDRRKK